MHRAFAVRHRDTGSPPLRGIDRAAIAPPKARRRRALTFQIYAVVAAAAFVVLAAGARSTAYFPVDLAITRALQQIDGGFGTLMYAVSWPGYSPQVWILGLSLVAALALFGLRWEAVSLLLATGCSVIGTLVKVAVLRPRPGPDLVFVVSELDSPSFPSGHVYSFTAFGGFLVFLAYTLLRRSAWRTAAIATLLAWIAAMGPSRIHQGHHWFSDVAGAYLLGSLWLLLTVWIYRRGKDRFFVRQPVAPAGRS